MLQRACAHLKTKVELLKWFTVFSFPMLFCPTQNIVSLDTWLGSQRQCYVITAVSRPYILLLCWFTTNFFTVFNSIYFLFDVGWVREFRANVSKVRIRISNNLFTSIYSCDGSIVNYICLRKSASFKKCAYV